MVIPKRVFNRKMLQKKIQNDNNQNLPFSFSNNKQSLDKGEWLAKLNNFYPKKVNESFYTWRFFSKNSHITYFVSDNNNKNVLLFNIGVSQNVPTVIKGLIPFLRIHSIAFRDTSDTSLLVEMVRNVENFARRSN